MTRRELGRTAAVVVFLTKCCVSRSMFLANFPTLVQCSDVGAFHPGYDGLGARARSRGPGVRASATTFPARSVICSPELGDSAVGEVLGLAARHVHVSLRGRVGQQSLQ